MTDRGLREALEARRPYTSDTLAERWGVDGIDLTIEMSHDVGEERRRWPAIRPSNRNDRVRIAMAINHPVPIDILRQLIRLDPEAGKIYFLPRGIEWFQDGRQSAAQNCAIWNGQHAGKEVGGVRKPYATATLFGRKYPRYHVVFALHHGRWPIGEIDHQDGDASNDRPENLREATRRQNNQNVASKGGSSRFCGVSWRKDIRKWQVHCCDASGKGRYVGAFIDEIEAARAYDAFAIREHGDFARLNFPARSA